MSTVNVRYIVHDVEAAVAFYTKHFGFRVLTRCASRIRRRRS
jgi:catechol 2,3-dioxygenase-like lactoylglutathione lyase family enzyme